MRDCLAVQQAPQIEPGRWPSPLGSRRVRGRNATALSSNRRLYAPRPKRRCHTRTRWPRQHRRTPPISRPPVTSTRQPPGERPAPAIPPSPNAVSVHPGTDHHHQHTPYPQRHPTPQERPPPADAPPRPQHPPRPAARPPPAWQLWPQQSTARPNAASSHHPTLLTNPLAPHRWQGSASSTIRDGTRRGPEHRRSSLFISPSPGIVLGFSGKKRASRCGGYTFEWVWSWSIICRWR